MRFLSAFLFTAAAALAAPITQVKLINAGSPAVVAHSVTIDGSTERNVYIGPYTLLMNGENLAALCIAFTDESHINDRWNAYITPVASSDLSHTYHPTFETEYEEEAYLFSQIIKPGADRTGLQEAAWDITSYGITDSSYTHLIGDNAYIDAALANYNKIDLSGYRLVSDTTPHAEQEFLVQVAPEPGSLALFGVAMAFGAGAATWKRRRVVVG
ncbi:MAG TPA: PEP-CTERM sorting domain-containing protein [Bryobacteraceae bacterium]|jgi:hypothetical protein|nr:PEP-CTERM sorting domain-containing protein [Bryobacteraceae bacterium]